MKEKCCNLCGNPMNEFDTQNGFTIHKEIGYGSIYDMDKVDLHLCCKCFDMLVGQCSKTPIVPCVHEDGAETLLAEYHRAGAC